MENKINLNAFNNYLNNTNIVSKSKKHSNTIHNLQLAINDLGLTINTFIKSSITQIKIYTIKILTQRPFSNRTKQQQTNILKSLTQLIDYLRTKLKSNNNQNINKTNIISTTINKIQSSTSISIFNSLLNKIYSKSHISITNQTTVTSLLAQLLKIKLIITQ